MSREYSQTIQDAPAGGEVKDVMPISNSSIAVSHPRQNDVNGALVKKTYSKKVSLPKKSFVLNYSDSLKLNIIRVKPTSNQYFDNNILTRTLQPVSTLPQNKLEVMVDSTNSYMPMDVVDRLTGASLVHQDSTSVISDSASVVAFDTVPKAIAKSLHTSSTIKIEQELRSISPFQDSKVFLLLIVLFSVALLGYVRLKSSKFLQTIFNGLFSAHESKRLFTTVNVRNSIYSVVLDFLFVFNIGILVYETVSLFMKNSSLMMSFLLFGGSIVAVTLYFALKVGIFRFIGFIFSTKEETNEYIFFVGIINKSYGVLLTPFLIVLPFTGQNVTYVVLGLALFLYVILIALQIFRGFVIILQKPLSLFYLILYLCTLEILPVVIAYRIFNK